LIGLINLEKLIYYYLESLVGLVVIDVGFGRENYGSIPAVAIERMLKPLSNLD
jgi:hypothetical protein